MSKADQNRIKKLTADYNAAKKKGDLQAAEDAHRAAVALRESSGKRNDYEDEYNYHTKEKKGSGSTYSKGSAGTAVKEIQTVLTKKKYSVGKSGTDGLFGKATEGAVVRFQIDQEIEYDGIVGKETARRLGVSLAEYTNSGTGKGKISVPTPAPTVTSMNYYADYYTGKAANSGIAGAKKISTTVQATRNSTTQEVGKVPDNSSKKKWYEKAWDWAKKAAGTVRSYGSDFARGVGMAGINAATYGYTDQNDSQIYRDNEIVYQSGKVIGDLGIMIIGGETTIAAGSAAVVTAPTIVGTATFGTAAVYAGTVTLSSAKNAITDSVKLAETIKGGGNRNKIRISEKQKEHIFRDSDGHLTSDTPANRQKLENVANNNNNYLGKDKYGNDWYAQNNADGTQTWVKARNGSIENGGVNQIPKSYNSQTGLSNPTKP